MSNVDDFWPTYLKVRQFQNEFMKSSFLPKYEQKIVKISALTLKSLIDEQTGINEQAWKKSATLLAYLLSKLINKQSGVFHLLH